MNKRTAVPMALVVRKSALASPERLSQVDAARLVAAFFAGRSKNTRQSYALDIEAFRTFVNAPSITSAADMLLGHGHGAANVLALEYRAHLVEKGFAAATVNRHLASLRSLVKMARTVGMVPFHLEVPSMKDQQYRDTRGPGRDGFQALLAKLEARGDRKGLRDRAILRLLYERALRRNEVTALDLVDVDFTQGAVNVLGKGRGAKEWLTVASVTMSTIAAWVRVRGDAPGPLFLRFRGSGPVDGRLSGHGVYNVVRQLGEAIGIRARPHGLRHAAITEALDRGASVRAVARFSRHRNLQTLLVYDDNRTDLGGEVARSIAEPRLGAA